MLKKKLIPVFYPNYDNREAEAVAEVLKSGWIGLGPKTEEFENKFVLGLDYTVAFSLAVLAITMVITFFQRQKIKEA